MHKADREIRYIVVERLDKPGKKIVCQQLNYDATDKMIVYNSPNGSTWKSIPFVGIMYLDIDAYYISLAGAPLIDIIKSNYKNETFAKVFDSCQPVKDKFGTKIDIDDFDQAFTTFATDCK